jgi:hypothetical protein
MQKLDTKNELNFLKELHADPQLEKTYAVLRESFNVLQTRSQMLIGLVTICLTITGFSGIKIAESCLAAKISIFLGIISTLLTTLLLVSGPLNLQWLSQYRADTIEATLQELIHRRDKRTKTYHHASICLIIGLAAYTMSLAFYLLLS